MYVHVDAVRGLRREKKTKRREVKKLVQNSNSGSQTQKVEKWKPTRGGQGENRQKREEEEKMPQKSHICVDLDPKKSQAIQLYGYIAL